MNVCSMRNNEVLVMNVWKVKMVMALAGVSQVGIRMAYGNPDTGSGCGPGKLARSDFKLQKDIALQVMMVTTNGTFGSQTFGISTGLPVARMKEKSGRNKKQSSSCQPRSRIWQEIWRAAKANI